MYATGDIPDSVAVGDFNNDTILDITVINLVNHDVSVFLGHGNCSFGLQTRYPVGSNPNAVGLGDFSGDGKLDIAVVNSGTNDVRILLASVFVSFINKSTLTVPLQS